MTFDRRLIPALSYLLLATVLVTLHLTLSDFAADDALIHLRIARRLCETGEPYFNPGVAVMTSTSTAWILLLAVLYSVFGITTALVSVLNALASTAAIWFFARLVSPRSRKSDLPVALIVLSFLLEPSVSLMETPLALALLGCGLTLLRDYKPLGSLPIAIGIFVRPELAVFLIFALAALSLERPGKLWTALCWAALGALPFLLFELVWFGSLIPQAFRAKAAIYQPGLFGFFDLALLYFYGPVPYFKYLPLVVLHLALAIAGIILYRNDLRRAAAILTPFIRIALLAPALAVLCAYAMKQVYLFPWYVPLYSVPFAVGLLLIAVRIRKLLTLALLLMLPPLVGLVRDTSSIVLDRGLFSGASYEGRVSVYRSIGRSLELQHPRATLLAAEIGGLGYEFKGAVIDATGLASPEMLEYHLEQPGLGLLAEITPEMARDLAPDYIVVSEVLGFRLRQSPEAALYVWQRVGVPAARSGIPVLGGQAILIGTSLRLAPIVIDEKSSH